MPPKKGRRKRGDAIAAVDLSPPASSTPTSTRSPRRSRRLSSPPTSSPPASSPPASSPPASSPPTSSPGMTVLQREGSRSSVFLNPESLSPALPVDELVKRLKVVSTTFQNMTQRDSQSDLQEYVPVCLHLINENFLNHPSREVRLFVACSLADVLRVFAPEPPYKEAGQLKMIFKFLISQLEGLKDPRGVSFKRYYYLLENLSLVQAFTLCFGLEDEDAQDICTSLFDLMFTLINNDHSEKMRNVILQLLEPLVTDCDGISFELLDVILKQVLEPIKSAREIACQLSKDLIMKCSDSLEVPINDLLNQILIKSGNTAELEGISISNRIYEIIYELHSICPSIIQTAMPQLEYKLRSLDEADRRDCVILLAKMFSEKENSLDLDYKPLWQSFLGRYNDVSVAIRTVCVKNSTHFLVNRLGLARKNVEEALAHRQHDDDESVRWEVIRAIISVATSDVDGFKLVTESEDLLNILKGRTLDKKLKVRLDALKGLALIYKEFLEKEEEHGPPPAWIHNRILQGYYIDNMEDRILIERLLNTCIVPFKLDHKKRMLQLLYVYSTAETSACKALIEIQKNLVMARRQFSELLKAMRSNLTKKEDSLRLMNHRISALSRYLQDPTKGSKHINSMVNEMKIKKGLLEAMETGVNPSSDCQSVVENVNKVLKSLGSSKEDYYATIKILIERSTSVLVDKQLILDLLQFVTGMMTGSSEELIIEKNMCLPESSTETLLAKSCNLISALAYLFSNHFDSSEVLQMLVTLSANEDLPEGPSSVLLCALAFIGNLTQPLGLHHSSLMKLMTKHCLSVIESGSPRQGKMAVRCLYSNIPDEDSLKGRAFSKALSTVTTNMEDPSLFAYETAVATLGQIAFLLPSEFRSEVKTLITRRIITGLLTNPQRKLEDAAKNQSKEWVEKQSLPHMTRCMVSGIKTVARWLLGLKTDVESAKKFFKMLAVYVETGGGFLEKANEFVPFSTSEKCWLRLQAGASMLKIVEQKGVGDQFSAEQFCDLSKLMTDPVDQVRFRFQAKLHKGLSRGIPDKCLPVDFMGFYVLITFERDRKQKTLLKKNMMLDIGRRRDYIKTLHQYLPADKAAEQIPSITPDYMLAFAIPIITFLDKFKDYKNVDQLGDVRMALSMILEPLVKNHKSSIGFFKKLVQGIKNRVNAVDPMDDAANFRMYAVCDVAYELLVQQEQIKGTGGSQEPQTCPVEPIIPRLHFRRHVNPQWNNESSYLPDSFLAEGPKRRGGSGTPRRGGGRTPSKNSKAVKRARTDEQEDSQRTEGQMTSVQVYLPSSKQPKLIHNAPATSQQSGGSENVTSQTISHVSASPTQQIDENEENASPVPPSTTATGRRGRILRSASRKPDDDDDDDSAPALTSPEDDDSSPSAVPEQIKKTRRGRPPAAAATKSKKQPPRLKLKVPKRK